MVTRTCALVVSVVLATTATARAENPKLVEARAALARVQYDRARPLLLEALQAGTATPQELAELYRLSASTATVLGDRELAEQYYRRWLAIDPAASLPSSVAPKLREPFEAAQAYMAAHGRLAVHASRDAAHVTVVVASDPLAMVASVALDAGAALAPAALDSDRQARLAMPDDATLARIVALDEYGNVLVEVPAEQVATRPAEPPPPPPPAEPTPMFRRPIAWAIPTLAVAGVALGFGVAARGAHGDLETIVAQSDQYTLADAEDARARRDRYALVANVGFAVTGALAVATAIVYATRPPATASRTTAVVPVAAPSGVGLSAVGHW